MNLWKNTSLLVFDQNIRLPSQYKSSPSGKRETIKELCALKIKYNPGLNKPRDPNSISKDIYSQYFF